MNSSESIEYKFLEDTYDVILCMQNANACLGYCREIMLGLQVMPSVIRLESLVGENADFPVSGD